MTPDEIEAFKKSQRDICKVQDDVLDLIGRFTSALGSSTSLSFLLKTKDIEEAKRKTIKDHITQMDKLLKIANVMRDEIKKFALPNLEKYSNMQVLLDGHTAFFKSAEQFLKAATPFRASLTVGPSKFYSGPLKNVHMTIIDDKIELIVDHYQNMLIAYRKYKPYGPF